MAKNDGGVEQELDDCSLQYRLFMYMKGNNTQS